MPSALLIGHEGQDGTYLARLLREKSYSVTGLGRQSFLSDEAIPLNHFDIANHASMTDLLAQLRPQEVYYLAAFHSSSEDQLGSASELVARSFSVNALALNNVLGAIASASPRSRLFYASSSRVFGSPDCCPQNEDTPQRPVCAYGMSKKAGMEICSYYRRDHRTFAAVGVLYNHESPLRTSRYLSQKIVRTAVRISRGAATELILGDLEARVDWGYAPDYARAMWLILQLERPDDFVIGTGELHSVAEFAAIAFEELGLDWTRYVKSRAEILNRTLPQCPLCADSTKLRAATGWRPQTDFRQMIQVMIRDELACFSA